MDAKDKLQERVYGKKLNRSGSEPPFVAGEQVEVWQASKLAWEPGWTVILLEGRYVLLRAGDRVSALPIESVRRKASSWT